MLFHPSDDSDSCTFLAPQNIGICTISLGNWKTLVSGVSSRWKLTSQLTCFPGGLILSKDRAAMFLDHHDSCNPKLVDKAMNFCQMDVSKASRAKGRMVVYRRSCKGFETDQRWSRPLRKILLQSTNPLHLHQTHGSKTAVLSCQVAH